MDDRNQEANQQRQSGQDAARDQRQDAGGREPFAEVGEDVKAGDDPEDDNRRDVERGVAARGQERQVFAGDALGRSRSSMSCWTRSIGTGKTITVFRSTPISVRVCR